MQVAEAADTFITDATEMPKAALNIKRRKGREGRRREEGKRRSLIAMASNLFIDLQPNSESWGL